MAMMVELLNKRIVEMKDLRQREERQDNKAAQAAVDKKFSLLTAQIHQLIEALKWTKENLQFQLNEQLLLSIENILIDNKLSIRSGYADKDAVNNVETGLKNIQQDIKKEWSKKYSALTNSTISTLNVIYSIDSGSISKCLEGIKKGASWTTDIAEYSTMAKSLYEAKNLISELGLDQQIIDFLQKMNSGKATLADLNGDVASWLKKESLDQRVFLSFVKGAGIR